MKDWPESIINLSRTDQEARDDETRRVDTFATVQVDQTVINRHSELGKLLRDILILYECLKFKGGSNHRSLIALQSRLRFEVTYSLRPSYRISGRAEIPHC